MNERNKYTYHVEKPDLARKKRNFFIIGLIFILLSISFINMISTSMYLIYQHGFKIVTSHGIFILFSIFMMFIVMFIPYKFYDKNKVTLFMLIGSMLTIMFIIICGFYVPSAKRFVPTINGAIGWIRIGGLSIQPSELLKIPFIMILAHLIEAGYNKNYSQIKMLINLLIILFIFVALLIWQHDMGTAIHYIAIFAFMLFLTNLSMKFICFISGFIIASLAGAGVMLYKSNILLSPDYKYGRVLSFLKGLFLNEYDNKIGYQVKQSIYAFGNGGIAGTGFANGVQKYNYLPEVTTDFVMSSFGEEFGFLGMLLVLILFFLLFIAIKDVAISSKDNFGKYLAMGIAGMIITQMLINVFVTLGMLPVFGIPIPFFSYGGTALLTIMISIGIVLNINNWRQR